MEEEMKMAETSHGDAGSSEEESGVDMSNNSPEPNKRGRGRPKGSKKLQVCVTDVNLMKLPSGITNGDAQPQRGRGRPKGSTKKKESGVLTPQRGRGRPKGSVSKKRAYNEDDAETDHPPKKKSWPKESTGKKASTGQDELGADLPNGDSDPSKTSNMKPNEETSGEENGGSSASPRKRGRPRGSLTTKHQTKVNSEESEADLSDENINSSKGGRGTPKKVMKSVSNGIKNTSHRGRGRPRKEKSDSGKQQDQDTDGSPPAKRGRGRPKGSLNKKFSPYKTPGKVGRPKRVHISPVRMEMEMVLSTRRTKRGRPRKNPAKRGRPRKYPLLSPDELKKPKVWKPLGRPRKYPRPDPPEGMLPTPRRGRGRPRKIESKRGTHLYKSLPLTDPSSPSSPNDEIPRKRGRPSSIAKGEDGTTRKRGRPKGSPNKNKALNEMRADSALPVKRPKAKSDLFTDEEDSKEGKTEEEADHDRDTVTPDDKENTEETVSDEDAGFGVLDGCDLPESTAASRN